MIRKDMIAPQKQYMKDISLWSNLFKPIQINDKIKVSKYVLYINDMTFGKNHSVLLDISKSELIKKLSKYDVIIFYTGVKCQLDRLFYLAYQESDKNVVIIKTCPSREYDWMDFKDFELRNKQGERLHACHLCD